MKHLTKTLAAAIVFFSFAANTFAQVTASAPATATIVSPIAIARTVDLQFGNVAASALAGTVTMDPAGVRTPGGGVTLPATTGTVTAASFTVTGTAGYTYAITLPVGATTLANGANTMTVDNFSSTPSGTGTLTGGTSTLTVGARLNVGANQAAGLYTSTANFVVTVNYN